MVSLVCVGCQHLKLSRVVRTEVLARTEEKQVQIEGLVGDHGRYAWCAANNKTFEGIIEVRVNRREVQDSWGPVGLLRVGSRADANFARKYCNETDMGECWPETEHPFQFSPVLSVFIFFLFFFCLYCLRSRAYKSD